MSTRRLRTILLALAASVATIGAVFYFESDHEDDSYTMVNVGGEKNKCSCTQRLER